MTLFFYLFKLQNNFNYASDYISLSLRKHTWYFEAYFEIMRDFNNRIFLVVPLVEGALRVL